MKRAIFFAINRYPAPNALAGCITDAYCWQGLLAGGHGLPCSLVLDENCTTERMRDEIAAAVASTKSGDTLLLGYSGHGAILGDGRASLCPVDFDFDQKVLSCDDVAEILRPLPTDAALTVILDSCHAGGVGPSLDREVRRWKARSWQHTREPVALMRGMRAALPGHAVTLEACRADQTAADATIDGTHCGAFSHYAIASLCAAPQTGLSTIVEATAAALKAGGYEQAPCLAAPQAAQALPFLYEPYAAHLAAMPAGMVPPA